MNEVSNKKEKKPSKAKSKFLSKFDVNNDGKVDFKDVIAKFDVNNDGKVDFKDFVAKFDKNNDGKLNFKDVIATFDENNDGKLDINDIILKCIKAPGTKINREKFLRKELRKLATEEQIELAIKENPMEAGIDQEIIDKVAEKVIKQEKLKVCSLSAACSALTGPIGWLFIPFDKIQYYRYLLRSIQKLLYLYGFPQLNLEYKNDVLEVETTDIIVMCLGVMFGISAANKLVQKVTPTLAKTASKTLITQAATKTNTWYPIIKKISNVFAVRLSAGMAKEAMKKSIPVVGFFIGGTAAYLTFNSCCSRLKIQLKDTSLSNPNHIDVDEDINVDEIVIIAEDNEEIKIIEEVVTK